MSFNTSYVLNDVLTVKQKGNDAIAFKMKTINNPGVVSQLDYFLCGEVTVIAKKGNKGSIYVGGSTVSSTNFGVELSANEAFTFKVSNSNLLYITSSISGDGVTYVAV